MKKIVPFYAGLLIFYSIMMLLFIIAGSHGRIILENSETLRYLAIAASFVLTAIISLVTRRGIITRWLSTVMIISNIITIVLLYYQTNLLYPERFTVLSTFIMSLHLLGLILGVLITYSSMISFYRK